MTRKEFLGAYNLGYRDGKIEDYCPNDYDDIFDIEQEPKTERIEYGTDGNAYKLTISNGKELEQEPCEDCISRQAVIDEMSKRHSVGDMITLGFIQKLPSVNPKSDVLDKIRADVEQYQADCNLSCSDANCRTCDNITFGSIYRIIDKYKGNMIQ